MAHIIPQLCVVLVDLVQQKLQEHDSDLVVKHCDESWLEKKASLGLKGTALIHTNLEGRGEQSVFRLPVPISVEGFYCMCG